MPGPKHALSAALVACGVLALPFAIPSASAAAPVRCELSTASAGGGLILSALARSGIATAGSYHLVVVKSGAAGGSDIEQSGDFSLAPGGQSTLSSVSLGLERGASYQAQLTVSWSGGTVSCARSFAG
jgi:hypothetical protein